MASDTVVSRPVAVLVVPPAGRIPPHRSARGAAGKTSGAEVGTMDRVYLVWDASDRAGGGPDADGASKRRLHVVTVSDAHERACELAVEIYCSDHVSQLVVEMACDGTAKAVSYVGEVGAKLCQDYGGWYMYIRDEADRAVAAAVATMVRSRAKQEA